ncbi:MAG: hypothetical protein LBP92_10945 [Deltaproteobacteria bacterium]|nr:hypothetical protein [Deltaproteobacteria bacterium]
MPIEALPGDLEIISGVVGFGESFWSFVFPGPLAGQTPDQFQLFPVDIQESLMGHLDFSLRVADPFD